MTLCEYLKAAAARRAMTPEERAAEVDRIRAERDAFMAKFSGPYSEYTIEQRRDK